MLKLPAPAKLNLFLHITRRRADGYHELQTLFQLLDYGDELDFELRSDGVISVNTNNVQLAPSTNLVMLAATALQQHSACTMGASINLHKILPLGGGLGGGSSDAATTLIGLNKLWNLQYPKKLLAEIGLGLGADIPLFIYGQTAWAEGIGDLLTPVQLPERWYFVLIPDCQISTHTVFNDQELTRNSPPITIRAFREQGADNSCQQVVEKRYLAVKAARIWLGKYAAAQMTGTGACVFASFTRKAEAEAILSDLPDRWQGFVARGVNRSPAYRQ